MLQVCRCLLLVPYLVPTGCVYQWLAPCTEQTVLGRIANGIEGLGVLFSKLQQGVMENRQVLTIARMRAEAEELYGQRLADIAPAADKVTGGFGKDDGASVRKVRNEWQCQCT